MRITNYEIVDHGIDYLDYFHGCGTSFTPFEHVVTGCGMNAKEALDDALEQIAQQDFGPNSYDITADLDNIEIEAKRNLGEDRASDDENSLEQYYLSIRYNVA